ncbi:site-specific integrase, partial [Flexithrix dorotheae]|uniref:site-specific integrase n=1 Tax=Flexithrix dorotheae TaxID=70993 RepID=UPI000477F967
MKTFTEYLTEKNYSQNSVNRFTFAAQRLLDWLEMRHVLPQHVTYNRLLTYIKTLKKKGQSPRYINHQLSAIRHYFDYLIAREMIPHNPAADLYLKGVPRRLPHHLLSEKQLQECYQNYPENKPLEREIIGLMVFQGLRQREISRLTAQDFDLKNNTVFVSG